MKVSQNEPGSASGGRAHIGRKTGLLFCAWALVSAGVLAGLLAELRSDDIVAAKKFLAAVAKLTDEQTSRTLQSVERTLRSVDEIRSVATSSRTTTGNAMDLYRVDAQLKTFVEERPFVSVIRVLDEQGHAIYSSDTGYTGLDLSDRAYFQHHRDDPKLGFQFGIPIRNRVADKWVIPATRVVLDPDGKFAGVIVAAVDPLFFNSVWAVDGELPKFSVTLFRTDGVMLMRSPFNERLIGTSYSSNYVFQQVQTGTSAGTFQSISSVDGEMRLFAYRQPTAYPSLILVVGQGMDQVLAAWWRIVWIVVSGWFVAMLAIGTLTVWLVREWKTRHVTQADYRLLFDASPYPTFAQDQDTGRFLAVSDAAVERYGWSRAELLTMGNDDLYPAEDLLKVTALRKHQSGVISDLRGLRHHKKDGTIIDVAMTRRPIRRNGRSGFLATAQDVTEQLRGERARQDAEEARKVSEKARSTAEEQLRQSQKMEAVGQLTGGIAHDFNNILMVILGNADALEEEHNLEAAERTKRHEQIAQAVLRAAELTRQLLAFSRKQTLDPKPTDLNDLVSGTGNLLRRSLGEHIEINSVLADGLWTVNVDRAQLETALVNLCINARDAMPDGGKLLIETRNVALDKSNITQATDVTAGNYVMLSVTDTGSGMPPKTVAKVFEPFFTTKEIGKGTGLGLSMVYGFIKQSNGHITVHSEVDHGTVFRLYLPQMEGLPEEIALRQIAPLPRGTERILVVEDELQVRASVVQQLQSLGYIVSQAPNGTAGMACFEASSRPFDLMLTDVVMPGPFSGRALAEEVVRRWPKTKVVFMSGYTGNAMHPQQIDAGMLLLSKPFRKADLAQIVRLAFDGADEPDRVLPEAA